MESLKDHYYIHSLNFEGHGGKEIPKAAFSIPLFASQVLQFLDEHSIQSTHIFGYSMGGYVGMYLAKNHPEKVKKLVTLATKYYWDEKVSEKEVPQLHAETIESRFPDFARQLASRHAPCDWRKVLEKTKELLIGLGKNNALHLSDYASINTPVLLLLGDRDKMITLEENLNVYHHLPDAQFSMLPGTPHPIEKVDVGLLSYLVKNFC